NLRLPSRALGTRDGRPGRSAGLFIQTPAGEAKVTASSRRCLDRRRRGARPARVEASDNDHSHRVCIGRRSGRGGWSPYGGMLRMPVSAIRKTVSALQIVTLGTLLSTVAPDAAGSAPPSPKTISIAEARGLRLGTTVTVDGSVTVPSGAFSSSTFDHGFAI